MRPIGVRASAMLVCAAATLFQFSARGANIAVSGFNDDVVTEASPTRFGRQFDSTTFFPADWVETFTRVGTVPGLPSSHVFTSATGSGVVYHLQSYTANNVLHMGGGDPTSEAMTVISGQYSALHILAASGTDGTTALDVLGHTSDITLNFTDGSVTLPGALLAYDWNINNSKAPSNIVAIGPICINVLVDGASTPPAASSLLDTGTYGTGYGLYETTLNLSDLGLSARTLNSITFNDVNATHSTTGVFAVDGIAAPEPSAIALMMVAATGLLGRRRTSRLEQ